MATGVADTGERHQQQPMHSPVNWALLGLIIERPTYAYDLAHCFERRYGSTLALSNTGHAYTALRALQERELIEEIPGTRSGRQPKPCYRATDAGVRAYGQWLVDQVREDRRRQRLFVLALAALRNRPEQLRDAVAGYEQAWLQEGMGTHIARERADAPDQLTGVIGALLEEENRLAVGAKLSWVQYAREQLERLTGRAGCP